VDPLDERFLAEDVGKDLDLVLDSSCARSLTAERP
jgi:hypothetical protein